MTAKKLKLNQEQVLRTLDACYEKALSGIPGSKNVYELSEEYLNKYHTIKLASNHFIKTQVAKCTTSGFLTSLGGIITLPVALPVNLTTVWYMQLRMIATIAAMSGYNPSDDEVQTLCYICLTGASVTKVFKEAGIKFGEKITIGIIKKIPGSVLTKINQKLAFRFITKFGSKGIINIGKMVPAIGGAIGGGIDFAETKIIAKKTYNTFILQKYD